MLQKYDKQCFYWKYWEGNVKEMLSFSLETSLLIDDWNNPGTNKFERTSSKFEDSVA